MTAAFVPLVLCQTAADLPATDAGWTDEPNFLAEQWSDGQGQIVGEALIRYRWGQIKAPDGTRAATLTYRNPTGLFVRILQEDETGPVTIERDGRAVHCLVAWTGRIIGSAPQPNGGGGSRDPAGGETLLRAQGPAGWLDGVLVWQGYESTPHSADPVDPGFCPDFNAKAPGKANPEADCAAATYTTPDGELPLHERGSGTRRAWTGQLIAQQLLVGHARSQEPPDYTRSGPAWILDDPDNLLAYTSETLRLQGVSVAAALNRLCTPRRGMTWIPQVQADQVLVSIVPTGLETITAGSYTLTPATPVDLSLDGDVQIEALNLDIDVTTCADFILATGGHVWVDATLWAKLGDLTAPLIPKGWTYADPVPEEDPDSPAWRIWQINPDWAGETFGLTADGLRAELTTDGTGLTGDREWTENTPSGTTLTITGNRPTAQGDDPTDEDPNLPRAKAKLFSTNDDTTGTELTSTDEDGLGVSVEGASIMITGSDAQQILYDALHANANAKLLATVGIHEWAPLRVSWSRAAIARPSPIPRMISVHLPQLTQTAIIDGTVTGVDTDSTLITHSGGTLTIHDDLPKLKQQLAMLRARYGGDSDVNLSWTRKSVLDRTADYAPGKVIGELITGDDSITCNALITRRIFTCRDGDVSTRWQAQRVEANVQAVR